MSKDLTAMGKEKEYVTINYISNKEIICKAVYCVSGWFIAVSSHSSCKE